jgi:hypothetical protein
LEAHRATQAERRAAAERASCDRVNEVAAASRLGKLVVRFNYDLTLLFDIGGEGGMLVG